MSPLWTTLLSCLLTAGVGAVGWAAVRIVRSEAAVEQLRSDLDAQVEKRDKEIEAIYARINSIPIALHNDFQARLAEAEARAGGRHLGFVVALVALAIMLGLSMLRGRP